ncbi:DUF3006 domain-containing protein [Clostridium aestuarii]|uniref:DUF3006 domain-containing protein n=1 Tax=Clostridium aestuarii TaxID=338193 RepID=A0ABT4D3U5_9CLOT|nr:DUF3006 domain-containing protein [Clostridium aestuarii]MCY6485317.1 DUF3006 domain-containing protein [Clostridium aestuarii]
MLGIIDRFEEEFVVIELHDGTMLNMKKKMIPKEAKEGYVLSITNTVTINYEETDKRRRYIENITKNIWKK